MTGAVNMRRRATRVALIGAGYISATHAEVLQRISTVRLSAVVDPAVTAAGNLARRWNIPAVFPSVDAAIKADAFDCAHVLVPPDRHSALAITLLAAGKAVFLEKPMVISHAECEAVVTASERSALAVGVNHNFVFHPAFLRLRAKITSGVLGRARALTCIYNVPLRQIAAHQFGHWMFNEPINLLLEQAVHPLSQIVELAGQIDDVQAIAGPQLRVRSDARIYPEVSATLLGRNLPVQFRFAVGQTFPVWQLSVICDDGVIVADITNNRVFTQARTRWHPIVDHALSATGIATSILQSGCINTVETALSLVRKGTRRDPFFRSMQRSIGAFHSDLSQGLTSQSDARFGQELVALCHRIAKQAIPEMPAPPTPRTKLMRWDVAIIGGTGFIGSHVVERFLREGKNVSILSRSPSGVPTGLDECRVVLHRGDARNEKDVARAVGDARVVINLAYPGGETWDSIRTATVESIDALGTVCLQKGVLRLIHVSSIAALYLGRRQDKVAGAEFPDFKETRGPYARGKAFGERLLLQMHSKSGLPVVVLRPSVVVGDGAEPLHSGLGFYNNEQHCLGWNRGNNSLPFVLVEDVADAIWRATSAPSEINGRCYNLVGDVRPSARDYLAMLATAQGRAFRYHPQSPTKLWILELGKALVKRLSSGKHTAVGRRDILSRGMLAEFDCTDVKRDLGWVPVSDFPTFYRAAIHVHTGLGWQK